MAAVIRFRVGFARQLQKQAGAWALKPLLNFSNVKVNEAADRSNGIPHER